MFRKKVKQCIARIELPADLNFCQSLRDFVLASLKNFLNLERNDAYHIQIVVDELFVNAVRYGSATDSKVKINLFLDPKKVIVEVLDEGKGKSDVRASDLQKRINKAHKELTGMVNNNEINFDLHGRGLAQIVTAWTDKLEFVDLDEGGILVRIEKKV